ncbi:hypothetical protein PISMIDRAFT_672150 [Pisolithus microcarpus 441]|uniref:Uncharacterized protein n=1 Tax=Pisolithus microcarpus 441 TaxID=765257 RepID=A0A0D0A521_9AGAM|nr:hypothetical protein PISMIDRAFT_672150 [Pisolithus microcarpus 441]
MYCGWVSYNLETTRINVGNSHLRRTQQLGRTIRLVRDVALVYESIRRDVGRVVS